MIRVLLAFTPIDVENHQILLLHPQIPGKWIREGGKLRMWPTWDSLGCDLHLSLQDFSPWWGPVKNPSHLKGFSTAYRTQGTKRSNTLAMFDHPRFLFVPFRCHEKRAGFSSTGPPRLIAPSLWNNLTKAKVKVRLIAENKTWIPKYLQDLTTTCHFSKVWHSDWAYTKLFHHAQSRAPCQANKEMHLEPQCGPGGVLLFDCLCGNMSCKPPVPKDCGVLTCCSEVGPDRVKWSPPSQCWASTCEHSKFHRLVFFCGAWRGNGCHNGLSKAGIRRPNVQVFFELLLVFFVHTAIQAQYLANKPCLFLPSGGPAGTEQRKGRFCNSLQKGGKRCSAS